MITETVDKVMDELRSCKFFDNPMLDESTFRVCLKKRLMKCNVVDNITKMHTILDSVYEESLSKSIDTTLKSLEQKGLISKIQTENGESFKLND